MSKLIGFKKKQMLNGPLLYQLMEREVCSSQELGQKKEKIFFKESFSTMQRLLGKRKAIGIKNFAFM